MSDEHYYPTVLAAAGLSNETTCAGNAMHVDWARAPGNGSPFTYWMKVGTHGLRVAATEPAVRLMHRARAPAQLECTLRC